MSDEELARLAAPCDRAFDISELKPPTPRMRREEAIARRKKPGRPRVGKGAKRVLITMEQGLLEQVDRHTKLHQTTRAAFIADAVRLKLKKSA